jgi:hypothetical protein
LPRKHAAWWSKGLPALVSAGLLARLLWLYPTVLPATALLDWPRLAAVTALLVLALFAWDAVCIRYWFAWPDHPLRFGTALHARGSSYLFSALNYELGQGVLAWRLARAQGLSTVAVLAGCVLLACHDIGVLLGLGFLGALASPDPRLGGVRWLGGVGLVYLAGLIVLPGLLPTAWRSRWLETRWWTWLGAWSWRRSLGLCLLRLAYFGIILAYVAAALRVCGIPLDGRRTVSVIPLVLLVDGLPISVSGFGTREFTLLYLLNPDDPPVVLAFSIIWSFGLFAGRLLIGLAHWWLPGCPRPAELTAGDEKEGEPHDDSGDRGGRFRGQPCGR